MHRALVSRGNKHGLVCSEQWSVSSSKRHSMASHKKSDYLTVLKAFRVQHHAGGEAADVMGGDEGDLHVAVVLVVYRDLRGGLSGYLTETNRLYYSLHTGGAGWRSGRRRAGP